MPVMEFGGNDSWGYDPAYFLAPDKYYGPKNGLKRFIDSCHNRGIAVIMDIALNHATGDCPLAALYWNASAGQPAPNNPWFNVTAPHPFSVFNDFNHESPATKYFFKRVTEHWLTEYKIDGFRFDLSEGYTQTNSGSDVNLWSQYDASRVAIWKAYYDTLQVKSPGSYAILEHFANDNEEIALSDYGMMLWGNSNYNFSQAAMGYNTDWNFERAIFSVRNWNKPYLVTYMESHDEERLMYKNINFGAALGNYSTKDTATALKRVEMCEAFLMTIPGPKMIWQFGELGYDYPINYCISNGTTSNDCRVGRKPVRWDYLQQERRRRLYDVYGSLGKLRYNGWYKDVFTANNTTIERSLGGPFKWLKVRSATDSSQVVIVGNFDLVQQTAAVTFNTAGTWYDYLNGNTFTATGAAQNITLQAGEYHIYVNRNLTNVVTTPVIDIINAGKELQAFVYPNPVNKSSLLELNIPETGSVQINMYNLTGGLIRNVYSGNMSKGIHFVSLLDKINNLAGGMYLIKVQTKNDSRTLKMLAQ
jgi:1,4-alpha-glucan branching enzyme